MKIKNYVSIKSILILVVVVVALFLSFVLPKSNFFRVRNMSYVNEAVYASARMLISNNKNNVTLSGNCNSGVEYVSISKIKYEGNLEYDVIDDRIYVNFLTDIKYLFVPDVLKKSDMSIRLNEENSYVIVKYDCKKKDYYYAEFSSEEKEGYSFMNWIKK